MLKIKTKVEKTKDGISDISIKLTTKNDMVGEYMSVIANLTRVLVQKYNINVKEITKIVKIASEQ